MNEQLKQLHKPFPLDSVGFKPQTVNQGKTSAMIATYIDARAVINRLDEVFPLGWEDAYTVVRNDPKCLTIECSLTVHGSERTITRRDVGESTNSDGGASRWKSATSDAFKRAAVKFGIGAYLYSLENTWVEVKESGRSVKMTPKGLKAAEAAYLKAVQALGLEDKSEKSQGQIEEPESPQEPPQQAARTNTRAAPAEAVNTPSQPARDTMPPERIKAFVESLDNLGLTEHEQLRIGEFITGRKMESFDGLTVADAVAIYNEAKHHRKEEPPFDPDPPRKLKDFNPHKHPAGMRMLTGQEPENLHRALGSFGCKDHPAFALEVLGREVESFTELTVPESLKIYEAALEQYGSEQMKAKYEARKAAA